MCVFYVILAFKCWVARDGCPITAQKVIWHMRVVRLSVLDEGCPGAPTTSTLEVKRASEARLRGSFLFFAFGTQLHISLTLQPNGAFSAEPQKGENGFRHRCRHMCQSQTGGVFGKVVLQTNNP